MAMCQNREPKASFWSSFEPTPRRAPSNRLLGSTVSGCFDLLSDRAANVAVRQQVDAENAQWQMALYHKAQVLLDGNLGGGELSLERSHFHRRKGCPPRPFFSLYVSSFVSFGGGGGGGYWMLKGPQKKAHGWVISS